MASIPLADLLKLTADERFQLPQEPWDSIPEAEAAPLSETERERRIEAHEQDPSSAIPYAQGTHG